MKKSIAVFGTGPGVGQAVARRYGKEGFDVVLVARRRERLDLLARDLEAEGVTAHVVTADLDRSGDVPELAERIRAHVGDPTALYYGPAPADLAFVPAVDLTPELLQDRMPITLYTLMALVGEFLPAMAGRGDGAILSAQGAAAVQGRPGMSGWPTVLAAQRNYLQSLAAEAAGKGVYVGMLYIGARILGTPFEEDYQRRLAEGEPVSEMAAADPADLAGILWDMHTARDRHESVVPAGLLDR
ncbi:SDR family NAD(P)-dependent oxidoreductase [Actinomadura darangshiensis]|uniref:SDR family NAD(P)-dependent oxidoreductase n=1 Tax=Actinomadura darangshiensis TaxID=705336 RepID=A0A4R4ZKJ6_9ACTN|nr:SDR family NAD(P)-dependent oxidoreductase [Actinomadura darangshiensis]TDD59075.1 SDR family NAD(P)-dependent oxidoreductase [Actinomadura darangshiensis]